MSHSPKDRWRMSPNDVIPDTLSDYSSLSPSVSDRARLSSSFCELREFHKCAKPPIRFNTRLDEDTPALVLALYKDI